MDENDDVVAVASVSESAVTVGERTVSETLVESLGLEGHSEGGEELEEDGGEIMVEVVGSDVFVDGVRGDGDELVKEGFERELGSVSGECGEIGDVESGEVGALGVRLLDARTETRAECSQETIGSSDEHARVVVVEQAMAVVSEEPQERVKQLVDGVGDFSGVSTSLKTTDLDNEAWNSEIKSCKGESLVNAGLSDAETQGIDVISEEGTGRGLVEESVEGVGEFVDGVSGAVDGFSSQKVGALDDEVWNPGIESMAVQSSPTEESLSIETQPVAEEVGMMAEEEDLNHKGEVPGTDDVEVILLRSEVHKSSAAGTVCGKMNKDDAVLINDEFSNQQAKVALLEEVGVMTKEEMELKVEVMETDAFDGKLHGSAEDHQNKVEIVGESVENQSGLGVTSESSSLPTKVVGSSEVATLNDKFCSNSNIKDPENVDLVGIGRDVGEVDIFQADSGSFIEQTQVAADNYAAIDSKVSISNAETQVPGSGEALAAENRVVGAFDEKIYYAENKELGVKTVDGDSRSEISVYAGSESSSERNQAANGNEATAMNSKVSDPMVEVPTSDDKDVMGFSEDHQCVEGETTCGSAGKDGFSQIDRACGGERGESTAMDIERAFDFKVEISDINALDGSNLEKEQLLKVQGVDVSTLRNVGQGDLEISGEVNQVSVEDDVGTIENEQACALEHEGKLKDSDNENLCLSGSDKNLKDSTVMGSTNKDDLVQADMVTSVGHIAVVEGENSAAVEGEKVSNSKIEAFDDSTYYFKKDEKLNTVTACGITGQDAAAQAITEPSGECTGIDMQVESAVIDCQGIIEVSASYALEGNTSISEKSEELKVERASGNTVKDSIAGKDSCIDVGSLPVGDHSTIMRTVSDGYEVNTSMQDEKQGTVTQPAATLARDLDGGQSINLLVVDELPNQGACDVALSDTVAEVTAGPQATLSCASFHNQDYPVSSSSSDFIIPLSDENQNLEVHLVSNGVSVPEGNQTMDTCVVDMVTSDEVVNKAIDAKDESSNGLAISKESESLQEESYCIGDDVQGIGGNIGLQLEESLDGSPTGDICWVDTNLEHGVEVEEQYIDGEPVDLGMEQEVEIGDQATDTKHSEASDEEISKQTNLGVGSLDRVHQANYLLPSENEGEFSVSDLVWGKVRSHPWWPGQIFDPADASEKAMKYHKKDCFLVAYFGDRTFAWNEASLLKPFWTHFSQIEKQSNSEAFHNAVSCALEEVSRRVNLGLACSCIGKDAYDEIECQIVENTGIRQESSRRYGFDKSTGASSFEPGKFVEFIRSLAESPSDGADRLELVIVKAQLLAYFRLKGYSQLPEFQFCGGLLENDTDASQWSDVVEHAGPVVKDMGEVVSGKGKPKIEISSLKRKHNLKDSEYPRKKEKSLTELMGDVAYSPDSDDESDEKAPSKSVSSCSGKKRKAVDPITDGAMVQDRRISIYAAKVSHTPSPVPKPSFKVGECISRVASQLTGSPSILKYSGSDGSLHENSQKGRIIVVTEQSSLDEMLSQLHLLARDPMKGYSFMNTITYFFSRFRNSVISVGRHASSMGKIGGGRKKRASNAIIGSPEEFEFDDVNDSYWTDRIIQNNAEEELSGTSQNREGEYQLVAYEPDKSLKPSRRSYSRKRFSNGFHEMIEEEPTGYSDERRQDMSPTELIMNFTQGDTVPSEMNLNRMFRRFGPLKESETEVDRETSRARVVFKKGSDAEVAFSSAGKFNIFGPMLVNYQLSYSPSISFRTLPLATTPDQDYTT